MSNLAKSPSKLVTLLMVILQWPDLRASGKKIPHPKCGMSPQGKMSYGVCSMEKKPGEEEAQG